MERRADLTGADKAVSEVLDEVNVRMHGILSGGSYHREFLDWLADRGYEVTAREPSGDTGPAPVDPGVHDMTLRLAVELVGHNRAICEALGMADDADTDDVTGRIRGLIAASGDTVHTPDVAAADSGILHMAMRYALGRATYAVGEVCDAIQAHADQLPAGTREGMAREIDEAIRAARAGMDMDVARWAVARRALLGVPSSTEGETP